MLRMSISTTVFSLFALLCVIFIYTVDGNLRVLRVHATKNSEKALNTNFLYLSAKNINETYTVSTHCMNCKYRRRLFNTNSVCMQCKYRRALLRTSSVCIYCMMQGSSENI